MSASILVFSSSSVFSAQESYQPSLFNKKAPAQTSGLIKPTVKPSPVYITYASPKSCIKKGGQVTLSGRSFGMNTGKSVAIFTAGSYIKLKDIEWTDNRIIAIIPNDNRLVADKNYIIGIKKDKATTWLDSFNSIRICAPTKLSSASGKTATSVSVTPPATAPPIPANNQPVYKEANNHRDDTYQDESSFYEPMQTPTDAELNNRMGTLIGSGQPPPPEKLQLRTSAKNETHESNELIIVTANMEDAIAVQQEFSTYGIRVKRRQKLANLGLVISTLGLPGGQQATQVLAELRTQYPNLWVNLNTRYQLQSAENHKQVLQMVGWGTADADCGKGLRIGMIDTVIDTAHASLNGQDILQKSIISRGMKPADADHGTAIASLLVGNHNNPANSGLLPKAKLIAANVFRKKGDNVNTTTETLMRALDWLISQKVDAINMSLGGPENTLLTLAIENTLSAGIPVISSAGNNGENARPPYPAAQTGVIGVTAVDIKNNLYDDATTGEHITFAAPGVDLWVAQAGQKNRYRSGTSYATPFVTAAFVLIKQQRPDKNPLKILQETALDLGKKGRDEKFGWGLIQLTNICETR